MKTGGLDASAPSAPGVVVNIATQSGTNRIRGASGLAVTPRSWIGDNTPTGTSAINGACRRWTRHSAGRFGRTPPAYHGSFRYSNRKTGIFRDETTINNLRGLVPGFAAVRQREPRRGTDFIKGTTQLSSKHQLLGFWQRDINPEDSASANSGARFSSTAWGGTGYAARLRRSGATR